MLCCVPVEHIDILWPQIEGLLEQATATSRGKATAFDIGRELRARDAQLWIWWENGVEAVFVTEIVRHPRKTVGRIKIAVGRGRRDWQAEIAQIEQWAIGQGATAMELIARPGWQRALRPFGYEATHTFLEKELA